MGLTSLGDLELNDIYYGDAMKLGKRIPDNSIDLIFTDPPYAHEYLYLYEWLAEWASRVLKDDGFLISYAGVYWKNKVYQIMDQHLEYFYDYVEYNTGNSTVLWPRKTISRYKSLLCYRKKGGTGLPVTNVIGVFVDDKIKKFGDKRYHKWGQVESTARYYIEVFTDQNDIVIDPFAGGGTTPVVCKKLHRLHIGFENDLESFKIARERLLGEPVPVQTQQLSLEGINV